MKPMLLVAGIFALFCCSCSTYQYITVSSPDVPQNSRRQFVAENDTMKLTYDFNGSNGPVQITVFNKTDKPLIIDMNRSALIVNDKAISFYTGKVELTATALGARYHSYTPGIQGFNYSVINATGTLPKGMVFIPSGSYITEAPVVIASRDLENIPDEQFHIEKHTTDDQYTYRVKTASFTAASSPLAFRTYLTFVQGDTSKKDIVWQHSFYVSEVKQTDTGPDILNFTNAGDQFYVSHPNSAGQTTAVVVPAAVTTAVGPDTKK